MSPYLFVLCMDKPSHLIHDTVDSKSWPFLKNGNKDPRVSHLMFVDDFILFGIVTEPQIQVAMIILTKFCDASGQKINWNKSNIMFSGNTPTSIRRLILSKSSLKETSSRGTYLGVPITDFVYLIDKV